MDKIIDFRVRPPYKSFKEVTLFGPREETTVPVEHQSGLAAGRGVCRSHAERSMDAFMEEMDESGIAMGVVPGRAIPGKGMVSNEDIADLLQDYPDRFIGFAAISEELLDQGPLPTDMYQSWGFKGVSLETPWFSPPRHFDDDSLDSVYASCSDAGLVVMLTSSLYVGPDLSWSDPAHIQRVAAKFPDLTIVVSHCAWPWVMPLIGVAFRYPNVVLLPDLYGNTPALPGVREWCDAANSFLSHRLIFGSAYPIRALGQSVEGFNAWDFGSDEIRARCFGENAGRILGIDL